MRLKTVDENQRFFLYLKLTKNKEKNMSQFKLNKDVASSSAVAMEDMLPLKSYLKKIWCI